MPNCNTEVVPRIPKLGGIYLDACLDAYHTGLKIWSGASTDSIVSGKAHSIKAIPQHQLSPFRTKSGMV